MAASKHLLALAAVLFLLGGGCGDDGGPAPVPVPGKITASAGGILGQTGNVYSVVTFAADWYPGATFPAVAGILQTISSDNYSLASALHEVDTGGNPTSADKTFDPGTYSVVFFVSAPGSPPSHFAEVRVSVNGDVTATAPAWSGWVHP
jgi:hypothetical protein